MKDLIQTLVARTLGLESVMQPSVGSLYEPAGTSGWDRSELQEVVEEVVVRPGITPAAGLPRSRLASSKSASITGTEARGLSAAPASASIAARSKDLPPAAPPRLPAMTPDAPPSMTTTTSRAPSSMPPVPRTSAPTPTLPRQRGRENVAGGVDPIDAAVRGEHSAAASSAERGTGLTGATIEERLTREPVPASPPASPGAPASQPPRGTLETAVPQEGIAPESEQPSPRQPVGHPVPVAPGAEWEQPVIQVTIGRVEVRAITPPQAAAPPARRRPFPSLEEYLERTSEARA